jgi:hypothetical protein
MSEEKMKNGVVLKNVVRQLMFNQSIAARVTGTPVNTFYAQSHQRGVSTELLRKHKVAIYNYLTKNLANYRKELVREGLVKN